MHGLHRLAPRLLEDSHAAGGRLPGGHRVVRRLQPPVGSDRSHAARCSAQPAPRLGNQRCHPPGDQGQGCRRRSPCQFLAGAAFHGLWRREETVSGRVEPDVVYRRQRHSRHVLLQQWRPTVALLRLRPLGCHHRGRRLAAARPRGRRRDQGRLPRPDVEHKDLSDEERYVRAALRFGPLWQRQGASHGQFWRDGAVSATLVAADLPRCETWQGQCVQRWRARFWPSPSATTEAETGVLGQYH
mmetsp:Transcript_47338/g.148339  ORF Transcript_47338/g.148339 Transcript_47338/m.148339 type:complete len:243 (+) Transcript_47338:623-1351(+)